MRLFQGDYDKETIFGEDPVAMAARWIGEGAAGLHIVDLDGARGEYTANQGAVEAIVLAVKEKSGARPVTTQVGGGIRAMHSIERWLSMGIDRVIIGTAAVEEPELITRAAVKFPGRVWVGIDARGGKVAVDGWTRTTEKDAVDLAHEVQDRGAGGIVYTNIERDGTGKGVDAEAVADLAEQLDVPVIASGGVHNADDVRRLREYGTTNIVGVIVGRALYENSVSMAELLVAAGQ